MNYTSHGNKKQQYQRAVREKIKSGLINKANGDWSRPSNSGDYMYRSLAFGYKLGLLLGLPVSRGKR